MSIDLNHTIVHAHDKEESATFTAEILGLPPPKPFHHFLVVETGNGVSLDYLSTDEEIQPQHYAFLVGDQEFDEILGRIRQRAISFWADPRRQHPGVINNNDGGRGLYFADPSGNYLEILTRPYEGRHR